MGQTALCVFTFESYIPIGLNFLIFFLTGQWHQKNRCGPGLLDGLNWCRYYCKRSLKHLQACRNPNCFFSSNLSNWSPPPAKEGCFVRPIWAGALLACRATAVHSPAFRSNFQYNPNHRFKTAPILFYQSFSSCPKPATPGCTFSNLHQHNLGPFIAIWTRFKVFCCNALVCLVSHLIPFHMTSKISYLLVIIEGVPDV